MVYMNGNITTFSHGDINILTQISNKNYVEEHLFYYRPSNSINLSMFAHRIDARCTHGLKAMIVHSSRKLEV